jgi:hypothetical protein
MLVILTQKRDEIDKSAKKSSDTNRKELYG